MIRIYCHTVLLLISCSLSAQTDRALFIEDMEKAKTIIQQANSVSVYSSYYIYSTHDAEETMSKSNSVTYLSDNFYYQQLDELTTFIHEDNMAVIDEEERAIILDKNNQTNASSFLFMEQLIDYSIIESVELVSPHNYLLKFKYGDIERIELQFNTQNALLSEIVIFYSHSYGLEDDYYDEEHPKLKVTIDKVGFNSTAPIDWYNNQFFIVHDNSITLKPNYSKYSLVNNLFAND